MKQLLSMTAMLPDLLRPWSKRTAAGLALVACLLPCWASAGPGEMTKAEAVAMARVFLRKCRLPKPTAEPSMTNYSRPGSPRTIITLWFGQEYVVKIDTLVREVVTVSNTGRIQRLLDRRQAGSPGKSLITNEVAARAAVQSMAKRLGVPSECRIVEIVGRFESRPTAALSEPPRVSATIQKMAYGYPLRDSFGARHLSVDPMDGTLLSYDRAPDFPYVVVSHDCKLSSREAAAKASEAATKFKFTRSTRNSTRKKTKLMLVRPNGGMGGEKVDPGTKPAPLRLAWVFDYPGNGEIWVDATDGHILGGLRFL